MSIWILTIGSSDVQLKTKTNWTSLSRSARSQCDDRGFHPVDGNEGRFQVPARVMGVVYSHAQAEQHFGDLAFPLIDNFMSQIKNDSIEKILLVLSDQSVFSRAERSSQQHPYWQDTCALHPILEKYLTAALKASSPNLTIQPLVLKPTSSTEGLDDWDCVLKLVQMEFSSPELEFPKDTTIYVSHQAATPAISSAVQFTSLSQFGRQVKFLVSSERDATLTRVLDSSRYLKEMHKREAKTLLDRYDYLGIEVLLEPYLQDDDAQTLKHLLNAAIQWNYAEFSKFAEHLKQATDVELAELAEARTALANWWWAAYESAYLGVIRLRQGNTVEAMFHSFRAFEGLAIKDANQHGSSGKFGRRAFKSLKHRRQSAWNRHPYLKILIDLDASEEYRDDLLDKRNKLFHQLQGFQNEDLFKAWDADEGGWQDKVLGCLNFVSGETFEFLDKADSDGKVTSLMIIVHQKLEKAIAQL